MSALLTLSSKKESHLSSAHKSFTRLTKKIAKLQQSLKEREEELEKALHFYHEQVAPAENELEDYLTTCIKELYRHYKDLKVLTKKERELLREVIVSKINEVLNPMVFKETDPELRAIFQELEGISYESVVSKQLNELKEEMKQVFKHATGVDVEAPDIDLEDDQETIMQKMFGAMKEVSEKMSEEKRSRPSKKTKRQIEKEKRAEELEDLQKRELSTIYKQLAKALHPDLEPDHALKIEKETLMKKLTTAYEEQDLYTLLSLEIEWMNRFAEGENSEGPKKTLDFKVYNSILKDQVKLLEAKIEMLVMHPRYMPIEKYFKHRFFSPEALMRIVLNDLLLESEEYRSTAAVLQTSFAPLKIRGILETFFS